MRTSLLISLVALLLCVVIGAGPAAVSEVEYPWGEYWADLLRVGLQTNTAIVPGYAFYLEYEGLHGAYHQYGVYACDGPSWCDFGGRRGTLYL